MLVRFIFDGFSNAAQSRIQVMVNGSEYTKEEIARRGREIYERDIRSEVEHDHDGRFLVVDITTGHYEIADDELAAFDRAEEKNPTGRSSCCAWATALPTVLAGGCSAPLAERR